MNVSREEKIAEAVDRMKLLKIFPETIKQFQRDGKVSISEAPLWAFYWANEMTEKIIKMFEQQYDALIYMGIRTGTMTSFLYVSDHREEWESDVADLMRPDDGFYAFVYNHAAPECSEIGSIGAVLTPARSLRRIW